MKIRNTRYAPGLTLIELNLTMAIGLLLISGIGILLAGGQRCWRQTYDSVNKQIKQDAYGVMAAFGSVGRKSNRLSYIMYNISNNTFSPVEPKTADEQVVCADAVEFRYWDVALDSSDSNKLMDVTKTATAYALFYLDGKKLKVDYGPYPPGAVPQGGGYRNTFGVTTTVIADNVTVRSGTKPFSHTTIGKKGQGCVRININITDPQDKDSVSVVTSVLARNIWPI